jgi:Lon protease-like protein
MAPVLDSKDLAALPIFPLSGIALFPEMLLPLHVFEPRYRALTRDALAGRGILAIAQLRPGFEANYQGRPPVYDICGAGVIMEHRKYDDDRYDIVLRGLSRVRILEELPSTRSYRLVRGELAPDRPADPALSLAFEAEIGALWRELAPSLPSQLRALKSVVRDAGEPGAYADRVGALFAGDPALMEALLGELDPCERLRHIIGRLKELEARLRTHKRSRSELN